MHLFPHQQGLVVVLLSGTGAMRGCIHLGCYTDGMHIAHVAFMRLHAVATQCAERVIDNELKAACMMMN